MQEASTLGQEEVVPPEIEETELTENKFSAQEAEMAIEETIPEIVLAPTDQDEAVPDIAPSYTSPNLIPKVNCA